MASKTYSKLQLAALSLLLLLVVSATVEAKGVQCPSNTLSALFPCLPAVTGSNPSFPSVGCCQVIRKVNAQCLCNNIRSGRFPGINTRAALLLPHKCHRYVPKGFRCNGILVPSGTVHRKALR